MTAPLSKREVREFFNVCQASGLRIPTPVRMIVGGWRRDPSPDTERRAIRALKGMMGCLYRARRKARRNHSGLTG